MGNAGRPRSATWGRRLLTALVALALAVSGLAGMGSATPAARAQETEQITQREFDRLTRAGQRSEVIFGPEDGAMELEEGELAAVTAGLDVENFLLHVEFENPYDAADGPWDYGVQFRATQGSILALILLNDGSWGVIDPDALIADGTAEGIGDGATDTNAIDLYVEGDVAHFAFNGDYVATVELTVDGEGDVGLFSGFLSEDIPSGTETGFAEWIVWSLEGSQTDDEETPDPDDEELSDDDLTATAEAEDEEDELSDDDLTATAEAEEDEELSDDDLTATAEAEEDDDEETPEAGDEPTYESPRFGYTLSYDDPWELADEVSDDDGDLLRLENRDSSLQIVGNETNDTPEDCIDALIEQAEDDALEAEIAQDERDRDLRDDSDEVSWAVLFLTLEIDGEESEFTGYYECRVIEEGESLLTIIHLAPSDDYNDDIENRTAVLDTIELDGRGGSDDEELSDDDLTATAEAEEETPEPDDEETPEADETPEGDDQLPDGSVVFILEPVGGAELFPFGSLVPTGPGEADVQMFAFGAEGSAVTIHEGTCRNPGPVEFDLGQIDETGFLDTSIEADVEDVSNGDFVMVISTDGTIETALACGVLEPLPEE